MKIFSKFIKHIAKRIIQRFPPPLYILSISNLSLLTHVLNAASNLQIHLHLKDHCMSASELAMITHTCEYKLKKLLRIMASFGFIDQIDNDRYTSNNITKQLDFLDPSFMGEFSERAFCNILPSIKSDMTAWELTYNKSFYTSLNENPELSNKFDEWNHNTAEIWLYPLISEYNFKSYKTIVDLGGGQGQFISTVLNANEHMLGILFDRTEVINNARKYLESLNISSRCKVVNGDLLHSIPTDGDIYCLNRVLLNMDDQQALKILENCRFSLKESSKLLIIDVILREYNSDPKYPLILLNDLRLNLLMGGYHRNEVEWDKLLNAASFKITKTVFNKKISPFTIIEATPQ